MDLGRKILQIRKENKMSQEEFSELFHVTRQTISSWENSKSYPDVETLIKISEKFNISLDILLKDKKMIKNIDKKIKNNKKLKLLSIILLIGIFLLTGFVLINNIREEQKQKQAKRKYQEIITNLGVLGFSKQKGMINAKITEEEITYEVYAKYPEVLDQQIMATKKLKDINIIADYNGKQASILYSNQNNIVLYVNKDGSLKNNKQNKNNTKIYKQYQSETNQMIKRMVELYNEIFK